MSRFSSLQDCLFVGGSLDGRILEMIETSFRVPVISPISVQKVDELGYVPKRARVDHEQYDLVIVKAGGRACCVMVNGVEAYERAVEAVKQLDDVLRLQISLP